MHSVCTEMADPETTEARRTELKTKLTQLISQTPPNTKGLRLDLDGWLPDGSVELVMDYTIVHPTKSSLGKSNVNWHVAEATAEVLSRSTGAANSMAGLPSTACQRAVLLKCKKYSLLTALANSQKAEGVRQSRVEFLACAATHMGEFSPHVFKLIERFVRDYRNSPAHAPEVLGYPTATTAARFRSTAKDSLAIAIAKGTAA